MQQKSARLAATCKACKQPFEHWPSQPRQYCSPKCAYRDRETDKYETVPCGYCQKPVRSMKTWPRRYCSKRCSGLGNIVNIKRYAPSAYAATCEQCGKEFTAHPTQGPGRFCRRDCWYEWSRLHWHGSRHWRTGRKLGRAKHLPPPTVKSCEICGEPFVIKPYESSLRVCCSRRCGAKRFGTLHAGPSSPHWRGGISVPYYGPSWPAQRRLARERDGVCQDCGAAPEQLGQALDVHHLQRFADFGVERHLEANDLSNLISLCRSCHGVRTRRGNPS